MKTKIIRSVILVVIITGLFLTFQQLQREAVQVDLLLEIKTDSLPKELESIKTLKDYQISLDNTHIKTIVEQHGVKHIGENYMYLVVNDKKITKTSWNICCDHHAWIILGRDKNKHAGNTYIYKINRKYNQNFMP